MATDTIVRVDPKTLLVGTNVRKDTRLTPEFRASIKENGVRIPITAYEDGDGKLVVVDGQRRTLAAVDAAIAEVPVFVSEAPAENQRIIDQVVVNEQRSDLHEAEAVAAVQDLALFDMKAPTIAKRLGLEKDFVAAAVKVGASEAAKQVYAKHGQLDIAETVAELEGQPEQAQLIGLAQPWQIREQGRAILLEKDKREIRAEIEALDGVSLVREPEHNTPDPQPLRYLYVDDKRKESLDDLPFERVVALAGDGLVAWPDWVDKGGRRGMGIAYGVRGWKARGLFVEKWREESTARSKADDPEKLKAERRHVRETSKIWVAASGVRIEWLQGLVQRKTMPKGWEAIAAHRMLQSQGSFSAAQMRAMLTILQTSEAPEARTIRESLISYLDAHPTKATQIMLAIELGSIEGGGDFAKRGWQGDWTIPLVKVQAYLKQLVEWGYELSEIEKQVVAGKVKKTA